MSNPRVTMIGLGQMGGACARRLAARGVDLLGHDASPAAREAAVRDGLRVTDSLAQALEGRDVVLTCLPNPSSVEAVWLGPAGLAANVRAGVLCIEMSSIDPGTMNRVAEAAWARHAQVLDCPVSGSPAEALEGKLVLLAGGGAQELERARPLLEHLSQTIRHTGKVGTGKVVKIVNNMMTMANILAASEAFSLGVRAGVEPAALFDILSASGGRSAQFLKRFPWVVQEDFAPRFKMELGEKDLALGADLGRALGQPTPFASLARELYALALAQGYRGQDIVALYRMYQDWGRSADAAG